MKRQAVYFTGEGTVEVREEPITSPEKGEVMVQALLSGISPGTESLIYYNRVSEESQVDPTISSLNGSFSYPLKYGYCMVGKIIDTGREVDKSWLGRKVFSFHPHESLFNVKPEDLIALPETLSVEDAVFFANMETAVSLLMDGRPLIGECVGIFGQGIVGLLTAALLVRFPIGLLLTLDFHELRRKRSMELGADYSIDPVTSDSMAYTKHLLHQQGNVDGFDLTYELTGDPKALNQAASATGYEGRVIIGSWYGTRTAPLEFGTQFHRSKIQLFSSQVSHLRSELTGRWNKERRGDFTVRMLTEIRPSGFITHNFPVDQASGAYNQLINNPGETLQITFNYDS
ncbi:MAG: zinc-dependent alcohol dehydrogenase [Desulfurivibrionaceae bacterium]